MTALVVDVVAFKFRGVFDESTSGWTKRAGIAFGEFKFSFWVCKRIKKMNIGGASWSSQRFVRFVDPH